METIYQNIREIRIKRSLTQEEVARRLFMVVSGYSKIERGETELTIKRLFELADIFNVPYTDLLGEHESEATELKMLSQEFIAFLRLKILPAYMMKYEEPIPYRELTEKQKDFLLSLGIHNQKDYERQGHLLTRAKQGLTQKAFEEAIDDMFVYSLFQFCIIHNPVLLKMWQVFRRKHEPKFSYKTSRGFTIITRLPPQQYWKK